MKNTYSALGRNMLEENKHHDFCAFFLYFWQNRVKWLKKIKNIILPQTIESREKMNEKKNEKIENCKMSKNREKNTCIRNIVLSSVTRLRNAKIVLRTTVAYRSCGRAYFIRKRIFHTEVHNNSHQRAILSL